MENSDNTAIKQAGGWKKGQSGNRGGRPRGSRNKVLAALDAVGSDNATNILEGVVAAATRGDLRASELILKRTWPEPKGRPVLLSGLPKITCADDVLTALGFVTRAVAKGELTPDEGIVMAALVEGHRRAIETVDIEKRLALLEQAAEHTR